MRACVKMAAAFWLAVWVMAGTGALAGDSGEERTIPVIEWKCFSCEKQFFSFAPDDLAAKARPEHKDVRHQQSHWMRLADKGRPVEKCGKSGDGAHFLEKKREFSVSGLLLRADFGKYLVLKSGGSSIKARVQKVKCLVCGLERYAFAGDDLDLYGPLTLSRPAAVFSLLTGARIGECRGKLAGGIPLAVHLFAPVNEAQPSSFQLASHAQYLLYSD